MAVSLQKFIERVAKSGLMTAEEVTALLEAEPEDKQPGDGEELAKLLLRKKKLTKYQATAVYKGQTGGLVIGSYVVLDKIGEGGMGQVFKAQHRRMKRLAAIKILPREAVSSPDAVDRFRREVEAAAKLEHTNIVTAYDADESAGIHFLIMQYVDGKDLSVVLQENGPLPVEQAIECTLQAARGLAYAHEHGIVHRDIKPANLLLSKEGVVKILDMGLARMEDNDFGADVTAAKQLTQSGQMMGTVDYMSPEQAEDTHSADHRADIYSLGCTLYRLLTGSAAFDGDTVMRKLLAHRDAPIPSLHEARADVSEALDAVFAKMLAKDPADRQQSMADVIEQIEAALDPGQSPQPLVSEESSSGGLTEFFDQLSDQSIATGTKQKAPAIVTEDTINHREKQETDTEIRHRGKKKRKKKPTPQLHGADEKKNLKFMIAGSAGLAAVVLGLIIFLTRGDDPTEEVAEDLGKGFVINPAKSGGARVGKQPPLAVAPFDAKTAKAHQQAWSEYLGLPVEKKLTLPGGQKMTFMLIPPGEFLMGSTAQEQAKFLAEVETVKNAGWVVSRIPSEGPQHRVRITKPFYLGKYEVTQSQWQSVMANNPSNFNDNPAYPVEEVSWNDIQPFLKKLNESIPGEKTTVSLPTEAQWEYACRSGTTTPYYHGESSEDLGQHGWFRANEGRKTHPVGELRANAFGLYDMHGNVWEWCADWFKQDSYTKTSGEDPIGPLKGAGRVLRGGCWLHRQLSCRSAFRNSYAPEQHYKYVGVRLAMTIDTTNLAQTQGGVATPLVSRPATAGADNELDVSGGVRIPVEGLKIDEAKEFTLELFATPGASEGKHRTVISYGGVHSLGVNPSGTWQFVNFVLPHGSQGIQAKIEKGKRVHVACVRSGDDLRMFVDGKLIEQTKLTKPPKQWQSTLEFARGFEGRIDEIRISTVARYDKNFTPARRHGRNEHTLGLYHCDETSGNILHDSSGKGHDGKILGAAKWVSVGGTTSPTGVDLTRGLVGHWNFEEGQGNQAKDSSGNNNHGVLNNMDDSAWKSDSAPSVYAGRGSLALDGKDDLMVIPSARSLTMQDHLTLAIWVKHPPSQITSKAVRFTELINKAGRFRLDADGDFRIISKDGETNSKGSYFPEIHDGKWHHLVARYDRKALDVWLDGVLKSSTPCTASINSRNNEVLVGGSSDGARVMLGQIDDVRIYNRALNQAEIAVLSGKSTPPDDLSRGLVGHWNFEEGQGTKTGDSSGKNNHGTLAGVDLAKAWSADVPPSPLAGSRSFDSDSQRWVEIAHSTSLAPSKALSLALWCKLRRAPEEIEYLFDKNWKSGFSLSLPAGPSLRFETLIGNVTAYGAFGGFSPDRWAHLAATYDGKKMAVYIDAEMKRDMPVKGSKIISFDQTPLFLGATQENLRNFSGLMDDVRIYNRALSKAEIAVLAGKSSFAVPADPERAAAEHFIALGGKVNVTGKRSVASAAELPKGPFLVERVDLYRVPVSEADLAPFAWCKKLASISLEGSGTNDSGLVHLSHCRDLTEIRMRSLSITDKGLAHLKDCKTFYTLFLQDNPISDAGLAHFKGCQSLSRLHLDDTRITDKAVDQIKEYKKLINLSLRNTQVTAAGVAELRKALPNCQIDWEEAISTSTPLPATTDRAAAKWILGIGGQLTLKDKNGSERSVDTDSDLPGEPFSITEIQLNLNPKVSDQELANLTGLRSVTRLNLNTSGKVTDAGLVHLQEMGSLKFLGLYATQVTDKGLENLASLKQLERLVLNTKVSDEGVNKLHQALPQCKITYGGASAEKVVGPSNPDRAVAEWVISVGGFVTTDTDPNKNISKVADLPQQAFRIVRLGISRNREISDEDLSRISELSSIQGLVLHDTRLSDAVFEHLAGLHELESIGLVSPNFTGTGLRHLKNLSKLEALSLGPSQIDDQGLANLPPLANLNKLQLTGTQITDAGLVNLKSIKSLSRLEMKLTKVTAAGVATLQRALPGCYVVWDHGDPERAAAEWVMAVNGELITDVDSTKVVKTWNDLPRNSFRITGVNLRNFKHINDDNIEPLKTLAALRVLDLKNTKVGDPGLKHLVTLKQLQSLKLTGSQVTAAGIAKLQKALPDCKIEN